MVTTGFRKKTERVFSWIALGLLLFTGGCANGVFYQPSRRMAPAPDSRGLRYEAVDFQAADGTRLTGWWLPAKGEAKGTVVHFHGNAQNMSTHVQYADWLPEAGYHLLVFDYRGYGRSEGRPSRRGLVMDGVAALAAADARPESQDLPMLIWGQSLGGTVALQTLLHTDVPVNGALIDSTFYSHSKIAAEKIRQLPWFLQPLRLLRPLFVTGGYDAKTAVKKLENIPLFFIHGEEDRVVPASHSRKLHERAPEGNYLWIIPHAGHCDAVIRFPDPVRSKILQFFANPDKP